MILLYRCMFIVIHNTQSLVKHLKPLSLERSVYTCIYRVFLELTIVFIGWSYSRRLLYILF